MSKIQFPSQNACPPAGHWKKPLPFGPPPQPVPPQGRGKKKKGGPPPPPPRLAQLVRGLFCVEFFRSIFPLFGKFEKLQPAISSPFFRRFSGLVVNERQPRADISSPDQRCRCFNLGSSYSGISSVRIARARSGRSLWNHSAAQPWPTPNSRRLGRAGDSTRSRSEL